MGGILETITAIATGVSDVSKAVVKGLPEEEEKKAIFKAKYPIIYARIRRRIYRQCFNHLRFRWHSPIEETVYLRAGGLMKDEQEYLIKILHAELKR